MSSGGTGTTTLADGGILLGSGAGAITATAQPTDGQLLIGSTGTDPVLATLSAGSGISITEGSGTITIAATGGGGSGTVTSVDVSGGTTGLTIQEVQLPLQEQLPWQELWLWLTVELGPLRTLEPEPIWDSARWLHKMLTPWLLQVEAFRVFRESVPPRRVALTNSMSLTVAEVGTPHLFIFTIRVAVESKSVLPHYPITSSRLLLRVQVFGGKVR